jgi:hypothetical protein
MRPIRRQRGWVGLVVLLLALLIVAVLSQTLLKRMGLLPDERATSSAGPRGPGPASAAPIDATGATPTPGNAIERARGLESTLQQQTQDMGQRIDAQTK